jgi:hypothetical protein
VVRHMTKAARPHEDLKLRTVRCMCALLRTHMWPPTASTAPAGSDEHSARTRCLQACVWLTAVCPCPCARARASRTTAVHHVQVFARPLGLRHLSPDGRSHSRGEPRSTRSVVVVLADLARRVDGLLSSCAVASLEALSFLCARLGSYKSGVPPLAVCPHVDAQCADVCTITGEAVAFVLPGLVSALGKIILGDFKQGE